LHFLDLIMKPAGFAADWYWNYRKPYTNDNVGFLYKQMGFSADLRCQKNILIKTYGESLARHFLITL
jgi:hypothetical protein